MSFEYSLVGVRPGGMSPRESVQRAADILEVPADVSSTDPRFTFDGLLVHALEPDEDEKSLSMRHLGFENNVSLIFSDYSGGDGDMMVRVMRNMLRVAMGFASDKDFRGGLIDEFNYEGYLAAVAEGELILNRSYWADWEEAPAILEVVPPPHHFEDLAFR